MNQDDFWLRLDGEGYEKVYEKVELGLFAGRNLRWATIWLARQDRARELVQVVDSAPPPVNMIFVIADKFRFFKWLFSKFGIDERQTRIISDAHLQIEEDKE